MKAKVTLVYDPATGNVDFRVDASGNQGEPGHDELHEAIAAELGRLLDPMPVVVRLPDGERSGTPVFEPEPQMEAIRQTESSTQQTEQVRE